MLGQFLRRRQRPFTCADVDARVERVRDGRLPAGGRLPSREMAAFKAHVTACNTCRQRLETEAGWLAALQTTPAPARLTPTERRVMQQALGRQMRRGMIMRNIRLSVQYMMVVAVLVLVVGAIVWWQTAVAPVHPEDGEGLDTAVISPTTPSRSTTDIAQETITIQFAVDDASQHRYDALIALFEEDHPHIDIQVNAISDMTIGLDPDNARARIARTADVFDARAIFGPDWQELVMDLTPFIDATPTFNRNDFPAAIFTEPDGTIRLLPTSVNPVLLAYNQELFEAAGLDFPQPGWTWEEFRDTVRRLTIQEEGNFMQWGLVHAFPGSFAFYVSQADGWFIDWQLNPPQPRFADPDVIEAVRQHTALYLADGVGPNEENAAAYNQAETLIAGGQAAMWPIFYTELDQYTARQNIGVVTFPVGRKEETTMVQVDGFAMSAATAHPQAAWEWINFLSHQPPPGTLAIPARGSTQEASRFWQDVDPHFRSVIEYGLARSYKYYFHPANRIFVEAVTAIISSNLPVEESLTIAQSQAMPLLAGSENSEQISVDIGPIKPPENEAITITFLPLPVYPIEPYRLVVEQFQREHPDIRVEIRRPASGNAVNVDNEGQSGDCFQWLADLPYDQEGRGAILSLDAFVQTDTTFNLEDFFPPLIDALVFQGELWGIPADFTPLIIEYNKDVFDASGIPYPRPGWTTDDFLETAVALTHGEGNNKQYGFVPEVVEWLTVEGMLNQYGANLVNTSAAPAAVTFTDPTTIEAVRRYVELSQVFGIKPVFIIDRTQMSDPSFYFNERRRLIQGGLAGMWTRFSNNSYGLEQSDTLGLTNLGAVPLPTNSGTSANSGFQTGYFIAADSPHRQACWQWITFLTTVDVSAGVPARRSLAQSIQYRQRVGPQIALAQITSIEQMEQPDFSLAQSQWMAPGSLWLYQAISRIIGNNEPIESTLANAQDLFDAYRSCIIENDGFNDFQIQDRCAKDVDPAIPSDFSIR